MGKSSAQESGFFVVVGLAVSLMVCVWFGACVASALVGHRFTGRLDLSLEVLVGYVTSDASPAELWGDSGVPDRGVVFPATIGSGVAGLGVVAVVVRTLRVRAGFLKRSRGGSTVESRLAKRSELANLRYRAPVAGRFFLGRVGRMQLATPNTKLVRNGLSRLDWLRTRLFAADRDSAAGHVAIIGLSQTGKTQALLYAARLLSLSGGPMILSSVKDDLLEHLLAQRRSLGRVGVFDPSGQLVSNYEVRADGHGPAVAAGWDPRLVVGWSPLTGVVTYDQAVKSAKRLTGPGSSDEKAQNMEFWDNLAKQLIAPMLFAAAHSERPMSDVAKWVLSKDEPVYGDGGAREYTPVVMEILERISRGTDSDAAEDAVRALDGLEGIWAGAEQTTGSIYQTATTVVQPWSTRAGAVSSSQNLIDLDWLLGDGTTSNTLFISAPPQEQRDLRPVLAGSVEALLDAVQRWTERHGPIEPPLTVVLDEIGNAPLPKLPEYLSVLASSGVRLVTLWQDLAQMKKAYGDRYTSVLNNSRYSLVFGGSKDSLLIDWVTKVTGQEGASQMSRTRNAGELVGGSASESEQRVDLLPGNLLREMSQGKALLLAGNNRPALVTAAAEWKTKAFAPLRLWPHGDGSEIGLPFTLAIAPPQRSVRLGGLRALYGSLWTVGKRSTSKRSGGGQQSSRPTATTSASEPAGSPWHVSGDRSSSGDRNHRRHVRRVERAASDGQTIVTVDSGGLDAWS